MRHLFPAAAALMFALPAVAGGDIATNAAELRALLRGTAPTPTLTELRPESGCSPTACFIELDGLRLRRGPHGLAGLARSDGRRIRIVDHPNADRAAWPDMDAAPLGAYAVRLGGKPWGTCLEFAHTGIGRSGVHQRWSSLLLLPYRDGRPGPRAHRFVGYWTGCDALQAGRAAGEVVLPVVERATAGVPATLAIVRHRCSAQGCVRGGDDGRRIAGDPAGPDGTLRLSRAGGRP